MAGPDASRRLGRPRRLGGVDELRPARASPISNPIQPIQSSPIQSNHSNPTNQPTNQPIQSNPTNPIQANQPSQSNPIQPIQSNQSYILWCWSPKTCVFLFCFCARPPKTSSPPGPPRQATQASQHACLRPGPPGTPPAARKWRCPETARAPSLSHVSLSSCKSVANPVSNQLQIQLQIDLYLLFTMN